MSFSIENPNKDEISVGESDSEREEEDPGEVMMHVPKEFPDSPQLSPKYKTPSSTRPFSPTRRRSSTMSASIMEAERLLPDTKVETRRRSASQSLKRSSTISTSSTSEAEKGIPKS